MWRCVICTRKSPSRGELWAGHPTQYRKEHPTAEQRLCQAHVEAWRTATYILRAGAYAGALPPAPAVKAGMLRRCSHAERQPLSMGQPWTCAVCVGYSAVLDGSQIFIPAPYAAQFSVRATAKQGRKHHANDLAQELFLTAQTPFDLGHKVARKPQALKGLLEGLSSLLCLAAITCEALLGLQAAPVSGFDMFFGTSFGWGHRVLRCSVWGLYGCRLSQCMRHMSLASVQEASPLLHALPGLPAFFQRPCAVYIRPYGFAKFHTVFRTPHWPREGR
jgi:hypothetical protein